MKQIHVVTPLWYSQAISQAAGVPVYLKMEALQPVGSFKARGMGAICRASYEAGIREVVCASGGNAGYAVAYAGRQLGIEVTIVVPETTSSRAKALIQSEGADLIIHGASWDDAHRLGVDLAERNKATYIHPFDDPRAWTGHATLVHEIAASGLKPGLMIVAVGGGGLLCGLLEGMHAVGWSDVPVLAIETEGADSFATSVRSGQAITLDKISSIATSLGARKVTAQALDWLQWHDITPIVVTDRQALEACLLFADDHRLLVEPACGAALSIAYFQADLLTDHEPVVLIVCGGAGVTRELLAKWDREVT